MKPVGGTMGSEESVNSRMSAASINSGLREREQITPGIGRMTQTHMTKGIENAFMGQNPVGERQFGARFVERRHLRPPVSQ
jgi:hypothetical protein